METGDASFATGPVLCDHKVPSFAQQRACVGFRVYRV